MNAYGADVESQAAAVSTAEDKLTDWTAKEAEYKKAGTTKLWTEEKARLEALVKRKTEVLNRKLIITRFKLGTLRADLATAQKRCAELQKKKTRSAAETAELADLDAKADQSWEAFIWGYRAAGSAVGFQEAIRDFYAAVPAGAPPKHLDYEFWIHMAILWLFEKHKKGMAWPDTIRAYNGSGARADHYRDAVTARAAAAAAAAKGGNAFTPGGI